jgi:two-component system chemotaxis response regulator CheY
MNIRGLRRLGMAKILVVDDAAFMRMRCLKILTEVGHKVIEAANGAEAVEKYKEMKPHGVLLDITMPKMDGIITLQEIIKIDPRAQVAMVTAMGQRTMVISALKAGAKDFILKPFDGSRVLSTVEKLLKGNKRRTNP